MTLNAAQSLVASRQATVLSERCWAKDSGHPHLANAPFQVHGAVSGLGCVWCGTFRWQDILKESSKTLTSCLFLRVVTQPLAQGLQMGTGEGKCLLAGPPSVHSRVFFFAVYGLIFSALGQSRSSSLSHQIQTSAKVGLPRGRVTTDFGSEEGGRSDHWQTLHLKGDAPWGGQEREGGGVRRPSCLCCASLLCFRGHHDTSFPGRKNENREPAPNHQLEREQGVKAQSMFSPHLGHRLQGSSTA